VAIRAIKAVQCTNARYACLRVMRPQRQRSLHAPIHVMHVWLPKLRLFAARTAQIMGFVLVAAAFAACAAGYGALVQPPGIRAFQVRKRVPVQPPGLTEVPHHSVLALSAGWTPLTKRGINGWCTAVPPARAT